MSSLDLFLRVSNLPESIRKQVVDFIESIQRKTEKPEKPDVLGPRPLGLMKGKIWISDDFNAPLDDLKPYME
ncbi:MAG: DUF2281 domain-containing protein [Flavobacteriales bacterium]